MASNRDLLSDNSRPADFNPFAPPASEAIPTRRPAMVADSAAVEPVGPLAVSVHLSDDDVADFLAYHHGRRSRLGPMVRVSLPIVAVVVIIDLALWRSGRFDVATFTFSLVWLLTALSLFPWLWRRQLRKLARRGGPRGEHAIEIGPGGLVGLAQGKPAVRRSWAVVTRIVSTEKHLFFYVSDPDAEIVSVEIVPYREFATPEDAATFLNAARRWKESASRSAPVPFAEDAGPAIVPASESLSVTFEANEADRRHAARSRRRALNREHRLVALWTLLSFFWTAWLGYHLSQAADHPLGLVRDDTIPELALFGFMLCITLSGLWTSIRHYLRRRVVESRGPITLAISPEGYTLRDANGSRHLSQSWAAVPGVGSDERYLILAYQVLDPRRGMTLNHLIPRRAFPTPEAAESFLASARRWHAVAHGLPDPASETASGS